MDAEISNSVVGIRSFVDHGAIVKNTVFMGADYYPWTDPEIREIKNGPASPGIGANTRIENAIIDRNVSIGANCVITNQDGVDNDERDDVFIRDGIVVVPKNVTIPAGTVI